MSGKLSPLFSWRSAICDSDLQAPARHVALTLSLHMNERGDSCFPSITTLEKETGLSRTTVCKHMKTLEEGEWLRRESGSKGRSTRYTATVPGSAPDALPSAPDAPEVVKELSKDQDLSRAARSTKPNVVWDALIEVTGFDPKTTSEKSDFGKTVRELRAIIPPQATAEDVAKAMRARRRAWEREYPDAAFTHRVLRGKWAELEVLARRLLSPADQRGDEIPERMTPEAFRAWRSTASREAISDYQHRFNVDDSGESLEDGF